MSRGLSLIALALCAAVVPARAEYVVAPDVVVFCEPTLRHALAEASASWRRESGVPVHIFASPTAAMLEQIGHRARSDLVIGEGEDMAAAAVARKLVKPETRFGGWRNRLVLAATARAAPAGDVAQLLATRPIALVDAEVARAGAATRRALAALGAWEAVQGSAIGVVGTADAMFLLREGQARLAIVYATDVAAEPALVTAAPLPESAAPPIVYWAAETAHALSPETGKFAAFLQRADTRARLRAAGLEVP